MVSLFGTLAAVASLTIIVWGLPRQIWLNYQRKSCEGLSPDLAWSAAVIYFFWGIYGLVKHDVFIIAADIPGFVLSASLVWQMHWYGRRK